MSDLLLASLARAKLPSLIQLTLWPDPEAASLLPASFLAFAIFASLNSLELSALTMSNDATKGTVLAQCKDLERMWASQRSVGAAQRRLPRVAGYDHVWIRGPDDGYL